MADNVISQLSQVELFSALDRDDLEAIARLAQRERYPAGTLVFRQGQVGRSSYLVESGELRALHVDPDGVQHQVDRMTAGDFFGESSLLLGEPHDATVEAVEDSVLLTIDRSDFEQLLAERPGIVDALQMTPEVERRRRAPRFAWQEPDETIVFVLHKHNITLLRDLILPGLAFLLILVSFFVLGVTSPAGLIFGGILSSLPLLYALYQIIDHFNDNYILTTKRVIHDEHVYLLHQSRVGARLTNIQSVQELQEGILAQTFGFGDLLIATAGEPSGLVTFRQIPDPAGHQREIFRQRDRVEARARARERAAIQDALHRRLAEGSAGRREDVQVHEEERGRNGRQEPHWSSWALLPLRVLRYFIPPLRYEEGNTITWRKHWVALLGPISQPTIVIALVTLAVAWLLDVSERDVPILITYGLLLLFLLPWWLWVFENWQNDIYQVTTSRIIDVERLPFGLREERREASLGMIQNVSLRVPGVIGRLFGYGSVTIETAGAGAFTFDYVMRPGAVQTTIFRRIEQFEELEREKRAERRRDQLLDWFTVYDQMRHPEAGPDEARFNVPGQRRDASDTSLSS